MTLRHDNMPNATCPQTLAESPAYQAGQTADLHHMMTETPAARYTPDILGDGLDIVFCGLNPAPSAVADGHNFSHPNNRFWSVLHLAGFTDRRLRPEDERRLLDYRCGITAVVARATRRSADVSSAELRTARPALEATIRRYTPKMVAFLGKRGATAILGRPHVQWGAYQAGFVDTVAWVLPNPSGLNKTFTLHALVHAYAQPRAVLAHGNQARQALAGRHRSDVSLQAIRSHR
jgi:TDG/mug DNA glycosylase family protein